MSISFSDLSLHGIEINYKQMNILKTYYKHIINICFSSKFALGIINAFSSFPSLFDLLYHRCFPENLIFFAVSNRKPIYIIETVKQIGRYLSRYADNRVYDLGLSICK